MTPLISVLLALATTLFGFGLASLRGDLLKNAPNWAVPLIFATSGALYVLAVTLAVLHFRKERGSHVPAPFSRLVAATDDRPRFVLEVAGSQTIDSKLSDWKFLLTNCSTRTVMDELAAPEELARFRCEDSCKKDVDDLRRIANECGVTDSGFQQWRLHKIERAREIIGITHVREAIRRVAADLLTAPLEDGLTGERVREVLRECEKRLETSE